MAQGLLEIFIDDACEKYPVDRTRLVLAGFSQGGFMAYQIALADPERYAGLMALSSWLPRRSPTGSRRSPHMQRLQTLVVHGSKDPMVPIDRAYASRDLLLRLKVPTVFREYEMAHEIRPRRCARSSGGSSRRCCRRSLQPVADQQIGRPVVGWRKARSSPWSSASCAARIAFAFEVFGASRPR
jgi:dienelactone hydrolase